MSKRIVVILFICLSSLKIGAAAKCGQIRYGHKEAPLKIIEYASPSCTVCSEFSKTIFPKIDEYIQAKKAQLIIINLPYNIIDLKACVLIKNSPNPRTFNTLVYQQQKEWLFSKDPLQSLSHFLEKKGMPRDQIRKALRNKKIEDKIIQQRLLEEKEHDIQAIPMLIIGKKRIVGLMPWKKLKLVIEEALMHINKGNPIETFGQDNENKKATRKTSALKKRTPRKS
jgi:protein-disulfide isomerase